ncbi:MAG: hypothetical protein K0V04_09620 [Deltaproteobacteria bacterium]|nr:hypothetical protein [Deltaproteobacteria bacterium]
MRWSASSPSGSVSHALGGIGPDDAMYRIGLRNGDRNPRICDADPDSPFHGGCVALTDHASFAAAFSKMSMREYFVLQVERDGNALVRSIWFGGLPGGRRRSRLHGLLTHRRSVAPTRPRQSALHQAQPRAASRCRSASLGSAHVSQPGAERIDLAVLAC